MSSTVNIQAKIKFNNIPVLPEYILVSFYDY